MVVSVEGGDATREKKMRDRGPGLSVLEVAVLTRAPGSFTGSKEA